MTTLRFILGDQLSSDISALSDCNKQTDIVMLAEVMSEANYVKHHKKKIAFLFSAMRHFAEQLAQDGYRVNYVKIDDNHNTNTLETEINRAIKLLNINQLIFTEPGEWRVLSMMQSFQKNQDISVEIRGDNRFLCSGLEFKTWLEGKKKIPRMEQFYHMMRQKHHILMNQDGTPVGGAWNYDKENRKPFDKKSTIPKRIFHKKSAIVKQVLELVEQKFPNHFGQLLPFHYATTHQQAWLELEHFIYECLPYFGDYQDAMLAGEPYLYHSLISSYLNAGLLQPLEICLMAQQAYYDGVAPLNCVEGFIRQILGWREFVRCIYWHLMPDYANHNFFETNRPLPQLYWTGQTKMNCLSEAVQHTIQHAYSHHIQRLMVTGNFALIAGLDVKQVQEWYLAVYSDAYEWVEMPNTLGMALYGDGGVVASKPYASSGQYIHKMSNFCNNCFYNPKEMIGEKACPFNALYWDFIVRNEQKIGKNQRMTMMYKVWGKFSDIKKQQIREQANKHFTALENNII